MTLWGQARARHRRVLAGVLVSCLLAAGCTATQASVVVEDGSAEAEPQPLTLELTPENDAADIAPRAPIGVKAHNGTLTEVTLVGTHGTDVEGELSDDKASWAVGEPLGYGKTYTLTAEGVGDDGEEVAQSATFTTVSPAQQVSVHTNVLDGGTFGVGMPVSFQFSAPVTDKDAAEDALQVTADPETEGGFYWFTDSHVVWRPKEYWAPGTEVDVDALIYGVDLGDGRFGAQDVSRSMEIGEKVVAVADGKSHQMTVEIGDEKAKTIPISMGKPATPTPHGVYTVMSEHRPYTLDSSTYGVPVDDPRGYQITVTHAARMSHSGIFYHSAPWSLGAQGNTNVSNGCINMSTENADWLMGASKPGDIIEVVNSGGPELAADNGWSVWQHSWKQWRTGGQR
jgi:lipoprotein-anchoring transpeptidase ErfK/SrfK